MNIDQFYNELKNELEDSEKAGFYIVTPSKDKETLDDRFEKFNAQTQDQKEKADNRSMTLYGMTNYDHYYHLLSKLKKGTKDNEDDKLVYNKDEKEVVKEDYDMGYFYKEFNSSNHNELDEKIAIAIEFNTHTIGRVIIYPTQDSNELESLYSKYMALDIKSRAASDSKCVEIFGKPNRDIYTFIKNNFIKTKNDEVQDTHKPEEENNIETSSIVANDLPLVTPEELVQKVHEDYSCFNEQDAESIKRWRQEYALVGMGIKTENYNKYNLERINILRKAIYENNEEAIIQCGWIPGIEFNSENRVKASNIVREKMEVSNIISYEDINESFLLNKNDFYYNFDKWESGKSNVLLITGFSGSGKSTLAKQLAKKYKCKHFELDCLDFYLSGIMSIKDATGNEDGLVAFINKKNLKPDKNLNNNEIKKLYKEYIKFLINWCKKQKGKFIIEGLQIYEVYEDGDTFITSCPIVIKGTSGLVSAIRAAKRDNSERDDSTFLKEFKPLITWALKDSKSLNKLEKSLNESYIEEASNNEDKHAVSIVLVSGSSVLAKTIKKVQGTKFSHASISLDDDISKIYSFNMRNGFNGLTYESIKNYIKEGVDRVGVYTFLVSDKVYKAIEKVLDNFSLYIKDTKYSILNLFTIPLNIPLNMNMKMVCSEFVDTLLKAAHVDLTNKKSSLVSPKDFINATKTNTKIVEVYNGHPKDFNHKEVEKKIKKLKRSKLSVVEFVEYGGEFINEAKSFPVQFDKDGNLILKNIRSIDFEQEYANSHRLLKEYEKTKSYEPMKFELAKMQFFITLLEKKIYKNGKDKTNSELKVRARFLNDFKKYLKIITTNDPDFNFTEYYEQSPFNDALIKIDKSTLKFGFEALKYLIK